RDQASKSMLPSGCIGVTSATRLPAYMRIRGSLKRARMVRAHTRHSQAKRLRYTRRQMKQHLAVSAIGSDRTGMVHDLTRVISDCGGSISESRMASLGNEFAMLVLVSGNW